MRLGRSRPVVLVALVVALAGCDSPARINVDNQANATYVAWVGDLGFIVPPKRKVLLVVFGWGDDYQPGDVSVYDATCSIVLGPVEPVFGTVYIDESGSARLVEDHPGGINEPDDAEATRFCSPEAPDESPSPS